MTNGAASPRPAVRLPSTGPPTDPTRKPDENSPDTLPRASGGEILIRSPSDDTVNMADPNPPKERKTSSCQYVSANAHAPVDSATMSRPAMYPLRSPSRWTSSPAGGAETNRSTANAVTMKVAVLTL